MTYASGTQLRAQIKDAQRVVVKIGSSSLTRSDGRLDLNRIDRVAATLAALTKSGKRVVLVSSGAVAAGIDPLGLPGRPRDLATTQACAAMGQGLLVSRWAAAFQAHYRAVAQVLLTVDDVMRRDHYTNVRQAFERLLSFGVIPVVNENDTVTTRELRFGDNDRLAGFVAHLVNADVLIMLTDVEGLYTAPPGQPGAKLLTEVTSLGQLVSIQVDGAGSALGTGGMRTKLNAAAMAVSSGVNVVLTHADHLAAAANGEPVGTFFVATGKRRPSRTLWIAHAAAARGQLLVDEGAARAITAGKKSLLLAGVSAARGDFEAGDVVEVMGTGGLIARGVVAYDRQQVDLLQGMSVVAARRHQGEDLRPVIHRDDLAVVDILPVGCDYE